MYNSSMKRIKMVFGYDDRTIEFHAVPYEEGRVSDFWVDHEAWARILVDEWDEKGRLIRWITLTRDFDPDRLLQVARDHPEVFQDLRFDVEGLGKDLTFEDMILRAWEKVKEDPEIAELLPRRAGV